MQDLNWAAIQATDFRDPDIKEGKQAECLVHGSFPWQLVSRIGTISRLFQDTVQATLGSAAHVPQVVVERGWYF